MAQFRWDGFDLAARGFNHPKPKTAGVEISLQILCILRLRGQQSSLRPIVLESIRVSLLISIQEVILQHMVRIKDMYYIHLRLLMVGLCFGRPI